MDDIIYFVIMTNTMILHIIDWFGIKLTFFDETESEVSIRVKVNLNAMRLWALQYSLYTRMLTPQRLVDAVKEDLKQANKNYSDF